MAWSSMEFSTCRGVCKDRIRTRHWERYRLSDKTLNTLLNTGVPSSSLPVLVFFRCMSIGMVRGCVCRRTYNMFRNVSQDYLVQSR